MGKYNKILGEAFHVMDFDSWDNAPGNNIFKKEIVKNLASMIISMKHIGIDSLYINFPEEKDIDALRKVDEKPYGMLVSGNAIFLLINGIIKATNAKGIKIINKICPIKSFIILTY